MKYEAAWVMLPSIVVFVVIWVLLLWVITLVVVVVSSIDSLAVIPNRLLGEVGPFLVPITILVADRQLVLPLKKCLSTNLLLLLRSFLQSRLASCPWFIGMKVVSFSIWLSIVGLHKRVSVKGAGLLRLNWKLKVLGCLVPIWRLWG